MPSRRSSTLSPSESSDSPVSSRTIYRVPSTIKGMAVELRYPPHFHKHCSLPPHPVVYNYHRPSTPIKIYKYDVTLLTFSSIERIYNMENMVETWTGECQKNLQVIFIFAFNIVNTQIRSYSFGILCQGYDRY
jgi:hypothetical protein